MPHPAPPLSPRTLALLLAVACLLSLAGTAALGFDLYAGLATGTFRLVRHPVTRDSATLFSAVAVMEAGGGGLCLAVGLLEAFLMLRFARQAWRDKQSRRADGSDDQRR